MAYENFPTMIDALRELRKKGYTNEYKFDNGRLTCLRSDESFSPDDLTLVKEYRFEGATNPGDMSIVFALETNNGEKGVVVSAYGPYGNDELIAFMEKVEATTN